MCWFVLLAVPPETAEHLRGTPRLFRLEEGESVHLSQALPSGWKTFAVTFESCSCKLYAEVVTPQEGDRRKKKLEKQARKKRWPQERLGQALGALALAQKQNQGLRGDVTDFLRSLTGKSGGFAILAHWFTGSVWDESFFFRRETMSPEEFFNPRYALPPDILVEVGEG